MRQHRVMGKGSMRAVYPGGNIGTLIGPGMHARVLIILCGDFNKALCLIDD